MKAVRILIAFCLLLPTVAWPQADGTEDSRTKASAHFRRGVERTGLVAPTGATAELYKIITQTKKNQAAASKTRYE